MRRFLGELIALGGTHERPLQPERWDTRGRRAGRSLAVTLVALAACVCPVGCSSDPKEGYSFKSAHDESIRTVAVPIFENTTFSSGAEAQITEAIIKEVQRSTRWTVVSSGSSDATLQGTLTSSQLRRLASAPVTGLSQEYGVEYRVDFEFRDNRSGKSLVVRRNFSAMETFAPSRRVGERIEVGEAGTADRLAHDIVAELRAAW